MVKPSWVGTWLPGAPPMFAPCQEIGSVLFVSDVAHALKSNYENGNQHAAHDRCLQRRGFRELLGLCLQKL